MSTLQDGGVRRGVPVPVLYENQPGPDADEAWRLPASDPVLWKPLPGEHGPQRAAELLPPQELHAFQALGHEDSRPLSKVAERLAAWPAGGLAPLADTRDDAQPTAQIVAIFCVGCDSYN